MKDSKKEASPDGRLLRVPAPAGTSASVAGATLSRHENAGVQTQGARRRLGIPGLRGTTAVLVATRYAQQSRPLSCVFACVFGLGRYTREG